MWNVETAANIVTVVGLPLALVGLWQIARQARSDGLASSASAVSAIHTSILQRLEQLSQVEGNSAEWTGLFRDLLNEIEFACALYLDGQFSGRTGKLAESLISEMLSLLTKDFSEQVEAAIDRPDTFTNICDFRAKQKQK